MHANEKDIVILDEETEIGKLYEEIVKGKIDDVTELSVIEVNEGVVERDAVGINEVNRDEIGEGVIGGNEFEMNVDEISDGVVRNNHVKVNVVEVNEAVVGGDNVEVNETEVYMNDGEVNDDELTNDEVNDVGIIGNETSDDKNDVRFHYDSALDFAFDDSDEGIGSGGLREEGIENLLGYYNDVEGTRKIKT
ncbi:hypothetical protein RYX36_001138 [Vicia faba]